MVMNGDFTVMELPLVIIIMACWKSSQLVWSDILQVGTQTVQQGPPSGSSSGL